MQRTAVRTALGAALSCVLCAASARAQASVDVFHEFGGLPGFPTSRLIQASNGFFYGTLVRGGPLGAGMVFVASFSPAGRLVPFPLHVFDGSDGRSPVAGLIQASDGALYGTTLGGGASNRGTVFRITLQGEFTLLHSFSGPDGQLPFAELMQASDGRLYGTTASGGTDNNGTIFAVTLAGDFTSIHLFAGLDGIQPLGPLMQATDGNFYGTTFNSSVGQGEVFRLTPAGAVDVLYSFDFYDSAGPGVSPMAALVQGRDGALYGSTTSSSRFFDGTVFRITLSGQLTVLARPPGGIYGPVIQGQDGALYATYVGANTVVFNSGGLFRIGTDGTLTILHTFSGPDGAQPYGGLMQASDGRLYGLTMRGGSVDHGTAYRVTTSGFFTSLWSFTGHEGEGPAGLVRASDGNLYGTTFSGGLANQGTVFRLSADGALTSLHEFSGPDGASPGDGFLQASNGVFYGATKEGGAHGRGTIYAMTPAGAFATLHSFTEAESAGRAGFGLSPLIQGRDGMLYGITSGLHLLQPSAAFRISPAGDFTVLARIANAQGPLTEGTDGNFYGARPSAVSSNGAGEIFRMTPAGVVTTVAQFLCDAPDGSCPNGAGPLGGLVVASDGALYGVTAGRRSDIQPIQPTLFRLDQDGLAVVGRFTEVGQMTSPVVRAADGRFYGVVQTGLPVAADAVYSVSSDGDFEILHVFPDQLSGTELNGPPVETEPGVFFGTAFFGGASDNGFIYRLTVPPGL